MSEDMPAPFTSHEQTALQEPEAHHIPEHEPTLAELQALVTAAESARLGALAELEEIKEYAAELEAAVMEDNATTNEQHKKAMQIAEDLRKKALTDKLTGLGNAHAFAAAAERLESAAGADKDLCYFDLGQLTNANNTGGHGQGDMVLTRASDSLKKTVEWCNMHCEPLQPANPALATDSPADLISLDRGGFRQGGDEMAWIVPHVDVTYLEDADGTPVAVTKPLAEVFIGHASAEYGAVLFCGRDATKTSDQVILGVSSLIGGYATGGESGAVKAADDASAAAKKANRQPVLRQFLRDHAQPAPDSLGRTVHITRDPETGGGTLVIDGAEQAFDKVVEDKSGTELPREAF
ncbi:MAG: hypothetical protein ABWY71_02660 [Candidatus Saccharimonadales bacterium]